MLCWVKSIMGDLLSCKSPCDTVHRAFRAPSGAGRSFSLPAHWQPMRDSLQESMRHRAVSCGRCVFVPTVCARSATSGIGFFCSLLTSFLIFGVDKCGGMWYMTKARTNRSIQFCRPRSSANRSECSKRLLPSWSSPETDRQSLPVFHSQIHFSIPQAVLS